MKGNTGSRRGEEEVSCYDRQQEELRKRMECKGEAKGHEFPACLRSVLTVLLLVSLVCVACMLCKEDNVDCLVLLFVGGTVLFVMLHSLSAGVRIRPVSSRSVGMVLASHSVGTYIVCHLLDLL